MRYFAPIARLFVLLALFVATIRCSTSVAQEQTNDIAAKLAEICRKHDVPAMTARGGQRERIGEIGLLWRPQERNVRQG